MNKLYMGIDVGSLYIKGVVIDEYNNIISSYYDKMHGNAIDSVKKMLIKIKQDIDFGHNKIFSIGVTGTSKKLVGTFLNAQVVKNEIVALASGSFMLYPNVATIIDIGDMEAKIINIRDGVVVDYAISNSCGACFGNVISSFAKNVDVDISLVSKLALSSENRINVVSKCMVFSLNDLIIKVQNGYKKEAGLCYSVAQSYINTVAKGKKILEPILFTGGVSKNIAVYEYLKEITGNKIILDNNSSLMGAIGIAGMARNSGNEREFDFNICNSMISTKLLNCVNCSNKCEVIAIYKDDNLIDMWGNKCNNIDTIKNV